MFDCGDRPIERPRQPGKPRQLAVDQLALRSQRRQPVMAGLVQQLADLIEREAERPPDEDLLHSLEVVLGIQPVARIGPTAGRRSPRSS